MEELQELAYILTKYKTQSIEIIGDDTRQYDSKLYQLYQVIQKGEVKTDKQAALAIYGEENISGKYRNLKHELKKRLFNTILFIDTNNQKNRDEVYYQCWKEWATCRILTEKSARKTSVKLAEKVLKKATQHDFFELAISSSILLRNHYALREKDKERFEYYDAKYDYFKRQQKYINLAHKYYMKLILDYTTDSVTANPKIEADAKIYYKELSEVKDKIHNIRFHYQLFQIQLLGSMGIFDYKKAKIVCTTAISYLKQNATDFEGGIRNLLLNKLVCHIQLKEFEEGKTTAIECEDFISEGTFNWFKTNEYFFMLSFHTGNYQDAYKIYFKITSHARFKSYKVLHETWSLYRMYLHFIFLAEQITPIKRDNSFNTIKLGKFLNNVPSFAKDKHGMNIPVLVVQMAFLILQRKYDAASERIDALKKYCDRYLKMNNPNFRCNCFIKMLIQIPISGFHRAGVERRAKRYLEKLKTIEINFNNQAHEVEVLPFEILWELILNTLQYKFSKK
ncbi:MAG: hypothetical protein COA99_18605 [Moraxellaceae bacterium]|nr:MAG: hypothetical protein COA99_18605 [Moraxellaceae bacterium]